MGKLRNVNQSTFRNKHSMFMSVFLTCYLNEMPEQSAHPIWLLCFSAVINSFFWLEIVQRRDRFIHKHGINVVICKVPYFDRRTWKLGD